MNYYASFLCLLACQVLCKGLPHLTAVQGPRAPFIPIDAFLRAHIGVNLRKSEKI